MATHALGAGTVNLCVNVRRPLHRMLGRMALARDVSMGALVRAIIMSASEIVAQVRQNRRNAKQIRAIIADGQVTPDEMPALAAIAEVEDRGARKLETIA